MMGTVLYFFSTRIIISLEIVRSCFYTSIYDTSTIRVMDLIRKQAKLQNWAGVAGIKEFCKTEYNATINFSTKTNHWTSITFKDQEHFKQFIEQVHNG